MEHVVVFVLSIFLFVLVYQVCLILLSFKPLFKIIAICSIFISTILACLMLFFDVDPRPDFYDTVFSISSLHEVFDYIDLKIICCIFVLSIIPSAFIYFIEIEYPKAFVS